MGWGGQIPGWSSATMHERLVLTNGTKVTSSGLPLCIYDFPDTSGQSAFQIGHTKKGKLIRMILHYSQPVAMKVSDWLWVGRHVTHLDGSTGSPTLVLQSVFSIAFGVMPVLYSYSNMTTPDVPKDGWNWPFGLMFSEMAECSAGTHCLWHALHATGYVHWPGQRWRWHGHRPARHHEKCITGDDSSNLASAPPPPTLFGAHKSKHVVFPSECSRSSAVVGTTSWFDNQHNRRPENRGRNVINEAFEPPEENVRVGGQHVLESQPLSSAFHSAGAGNFPTMLSLDRWRHLSDDKLTTPHFPWQFYLQDND